MENEVRLRACRHCGSGDVELRASEFDSDFEVMCWGCGIRTSPHTRHEAIARWNRVPERAGHILSDGTVIETPEERMQGRVVHVLHEGRTLCGLRVAGIPRDDSMREGDRWVRVDEVKDANCAECLLAHEAGKEKSVRSRCPHCGTRLGKGLDMEEHIRSWCDAPRNVRTRGYKMSKVESAYDFQDELANTDLATVREALVKADRAAVRREAIAETLDWLMAGNVIDEATALRAEESLLPGSEPKR